MSYVLVAVPLPVHGAFTYAVPAAMGDLLPGDEVRVPFGKRTLFGWVVGVVDTSEVESPRAVLERGRAGAFTAEQLTLYRFVADYWLAPLGEVIAAATPSGGSSRTRHVYVPTEAGILVLAGEDAAGPLFRAEDPTAAPRGPLPSADVAVVLREVVARPRTTRAALERRLHDEVEDVPRALASAVAHRWIVGEDEEVRGAQDLERWAVRVGAATGAEPTGGDSGGGAVGPRNAPVPAQVEGASGTPPESPSTGKARRTSALSAPVAPVRSLESIALAGLRTNLPQVREALARVLEGPCRAADLDAKALAVLVRKGIVAIEERPRLEAWQALPARTTPPPLNADQEHVVATVDGEGAWLLHGVTGAGKTEVYLALAARALAAGRQVLVLVPEIALTPQLLDRFAARFGERVAVLHSQLTGAERLREWRRIREGAADVAVGARSAIFAPFRALGLVVVDEEHDDSYKQEEGVRYHARDLAVVRGRYAGCSVVLGSATPSLESWENARTGRYHLVQLLQRATPRAVPTLRVIDMRAEPKDPPTSEGKRPREPLLAAPVREAIAEALAAGGKAILLYNRRGYATFVECPGCGASQECPSCGIPLVYHQKVERLDCHTCGFHRRFQPNCGVCGSEVEVLGRGTERVEEAVTEAFPGVPVGRMDADTTTERGAHARILDDFREGRTQLLVGTQVIAKGHDFPDVHVAAVLGVDHVLGMPDFRAAERTFALVTQLIGRAGRGTVAGKVFLQTRHPDHPVFACVNDMAAFAEQEGRIRRTLGYPPYTRLVLVRLEGVDRTAALAAASEIARLARARAPEFAGVDVLGPTPAPLPRAVGRWRFQVFLRGRTLGTFRSFLKAVQPEWRTAPGVRRIVDVDPRGLA